MSDSITLEAMLATLNKEQTAPIASANPYDARATPWLKMALCHNNRSRVWGMRITKIYLAGPWVPEPNKRLASNRERNGLQIFTETGAGTCIEILWFFFWQNGIMLPCRQESMVFDLLASLRRLRRRSH